jgi:hypothetical protein
LNFTTGFGTVPVTSPYDINKNRFVQTSDAALSRANQTTAFSALRRIAVPPESSPLAPREDRDLVVEWSPDHAARWSGRQTAPQLGAGSTSIASLDAVQASLLATARRRRR